MMLVQRHVHRWRVTLLNPGEPWKQHDRDGRPYYWRISQCADEETCYGVPAMFSEGSYDPFPAHPKVGEHLDHEADPTPAVKP